jgi:transposase-like protein
MSMRKRKFTKEQKLEILEEASLQGVQVTLDKHGLYPTTCHSWKKKLERMGEPEPGTDGYRNQPPPILLPAQR